MHFTLRAENGKITQHAFLLGLESVRSFLPEALLESSHSKVAEAKAALRENYMFLLSRTLVEPERKLDLQKF